MDKHKGRRESYVRGPKGTKLDEGSRGCRDDGVGEERNKKEIME